MPVSRVLTPSISTPSLLLPLKPSSSFALFFLQPSDINSIISAREPESWSSVGAGTKMCRRGPSLCGIPQLHDHIFDKLLSDDSSETDDGTDSALIIHKPTAEQKSPFFLLPAGTCEYFPKDLNNINS
ncbi:hypothetical protein E6O75_ATG01448 [Venturia nashicola]|uniref:Uncharacterized protein n=1 Tax=Venturia nashicola TaxID=86259 RepID=A0A4Z1PS43_9PEZI|nr:hypothetical protein E6O75_ATG01448 [Venturia nashicola]